MGTHSKKSSIIESAKVLIREGIEQRFPTYDAAIAEIGRLQDAVSRLAAYKRQRGRPKSHSTKKEIDQIHKNFPFLSEWIRRKRGPLPKGGRPRKNTYQEMIDSLKNFDDEKKHYAKAKPKQRVTDKEFIEFQVNSDQKMKALSESKRREEIARRSDRLKYFKEQVKKRKTS